MVARPHLVVTEITVFCVVLYCDAPVTVGVWSAATQAATAGLT
jgi:hypothetical protein